MPANLFRGFARMVISDEVLETQPKLKMEETNPRRPLVFLKKRIGSTLILTAAAAA